MLCAQALERAVQSEESGSVSTLELRYINPRATTHPSALIYWAINRVTEATPWAWRFTETSKSLEEE